MTRKPAPVEYDESTVEKLDYVPEKHERGANCWSGGFFSEGRRNPTPWRLAGAPTDEIKYGGLGPLAGASSGKVCNGCRRPLPLSAFSPKRHKPSELRSRCDRCLERANQKRT